GGAHATDALYSHEPLKVLAFARDNTVFENRPGHRASVRFGFGAEENTEGGFFVEIRLEKVAKIATGEEGDSAQFKAGDLAVSVFNLDYSGARYAEFVREIRLGDVGGFAGGADTGGESGGGRGHM